MNFDENINLFWQNNNNKQVFFNIPVSYFCGNKMKQEGRTLASILHAFQVNACNISMI